MHSYFALIADSVITRSLDVVIMYGTAIWPGNRQRACIGTLCLLLPKQIIFLFLIVVASVTVTSKFSSPRLFWNLQDFFRSNLEDFENVFKTLSLGPYSQMPAVGPSIE